MEEESTCPTVDKYEVVPKDTLRFTVNDFLVVCIVLERQVVKRLSFNDDANSDMKALLDSAQYIPFNLNGFIGNVMKRYYFAEALDEIIENVVPKNITQVPEELFDKEKGKINQQELGRILENLNILRTILDLYKEKHFPSTKMTTKLENCIQTFEWILSFNEAFSHPKSKPSIETIQDLVKESQTLKIDPKLPALIFLKEIEEKIGSWTNLAEKFLSEKPSSFRDKIQTVENIQNQQVSVQKGMGILDEAIQSIIDVMKSRANLAEMKELVTTGKNMEINLGNNLDTLAQKVKKVEDAHKKILKKVNNVQNLSNKLNEIEEIPICSEELLEIVTSIQKAKAVQFKLKAYSKFAMNITSRRKKSEDRMKIEDEDEPEKGEKLEEEDTNSGEEIQETLKIADELGFDWGSEYKTVQELSGQIVSFKERAKVALTGVIDASELKALKKEAKMLNINFQEAGDIKQKVRIFPLFVIYYLID